ncbi:ectoine/hydroxyectoine ABC transporter substrate-binding protein EhuB [Microbacterium protaetiae]|uniref:Ectoine/hydroxyectoine ABC transporter substrate-binding protein EhuB n=2 Tax=Microbacterium protaetiae TaxID=2509458 RepID=A0A4P6EHL0_9MICO|nr:ectoine/hydroxyectoine ABC transporter substrate-binding protein EhuB [Microbacterium protaetiae]
MTTRRSHTPVRIGAAVVSAFALAALTACSGGSGGTGGSDDGKSTLDQLKEKGSITVAVADERPYSWKEDGEGKGATIAIDREIFKAMGIDEVKVVEVDWNSLIPGLNAGRFDAVSAGMSILPDRCAQAAFSDPEIMYTTGLMVAKGNPLGLQTLDDVKKAQDAGEDVKLAVLNGGIEAGYADSLGLKVSQSVKDAQSGMDVVANGRADVFAMTAISLNYMAQNSGNDKVETTDAFVQELDGVAQIGAGSEVFRKGDTELLKAYNEQLDKITSDEDSYLGLVGDYGFTKENMPPADLTTEQLCKGDLG